MNADFVVDASMAFAWVLPSQASPQANTLLERIEAGAGGVVPMFWYLEVANGLLVADRRKVITGSQRQRSLERLAALTLTVDDGEARNSFGRTSALAEQHGLSVYDATYLELALRRNLPLGARDRALRSAARRSGVPRLD